MLDLRREKLVPLKTMAKLRSGDMAVFICTQEDDSRFRFCPERPSGSYGVTASGRRYTEREDLDDVVAIARPWEPKNGERVRVLGYGEAENSEGEAQNLHSVELYVDDTEISGLHLSGHIVRVRSPSVVGGASYFVLRCQLRRYVAPAALGESNLADRTVVGSVGAGVTITSDTMRAMRERINQAFYLGPDASMTATEIVERNRRYWATATAPSPIVYQPSPANPSLPIAYWDEVSSEPLRTFQPPVQTLTETPSRQWYSLSSPVDPRTEPQSADGEHPSG